jgi:hypothetical protein
MSPVRCSPLRNNLADRRGRGRANFLTFNQPFADTWVAYENSGKLARESTAAKDPMNGRVLQFFSINRVGECDDNRPGAK